MIKVDNKKLLTLIKQAKVDQKISEEFGDVLYDIAYSVVDYHKPRLEAAQIPMDDAIQAIIECFCRAALKFNTDRSANPTGFFITTAACAVARIVGESKRQIYTKDQLIAVASNEEEYEEDYA